MSDPEEKLTMRDSREQFYLQYKSRKNWNGTRDYLDQGERFKKEISRTGLTPPATVLEVGFGDGLFLDWAKHEGFKITGVELNDDFCRSAEKKGHAVLRGNAIEVLESCTEKYDLVVLFDVLEHFTLEEVMKLLAGARSVLAHSGRILARFPNGQSPFGRVYQYGDATHRSVLSGPLLEDIAMLIDVKLIGVYNSARPYPHKKKMVKRLLKEMQYGARDMFEKTVGRIYFDQKIPLDPNITVVLEI
jgi:2-polyprenyl-3-methyl-5-hydroxy-6-metoxy-1,4-benzoquinol methylase